MLVGDFLLEKVSEVVKDRDWLMENSKFFFGLNSKAGLDVFHSDMKTGEDVFSWNAAVYRTSSVVEKKETVLNSSVVLKI